MNRYNAGAAVVETLETLGIERVFGIPGSHILPIYDRLRESSIQHVTGKHESDVVRSANAQGRLTGKPGIGIVTAGPGAVNAMSGIGEAASLSVPTVLLAGGVTQRDAPHGTDDPRATARMFGAIAKHHRYVDDPRAVPQAVADSYRIASSGRPGPTVVQIPADTLAMSIDTSAIPPITPDTQPLQADAEALAGAIEVVDQAERPAVVVGQGALRAFAAEGIEVLADRIDAPIAVTDRGLGGVDGKSSRYTGVFSRIVQHIPARTVIDRADLLLGIGVREYNRRSLREDPGTPIVHLLESPERHEVGTHTLIGDLGDTLSRLTARVENRERSWWMDAVDKGWRFDDEEEGATPEERTTESDTETIQPARIVRTVDALMSEDAILVTDVGVYNIYAVRHALPDRPFSFLVPENWAAMGHSLPTAIGAAITEPNRPVIALEGDAGVLMNLAEFTTAVEHDLDVTLVIVNNHQHNAIHFDQTRLFGRTGFDDNPGIDFAGFADIAGARGYAVSSPAGLDATLTDALAAAGPSIVEVATTPSVAPPLPD